MSQPPPPDTEKGSIIVDGKPAPGVGSALSPHNLAHVGSRAEPDPFAPVEPMPMAPLEKPADDAERILDEWGTRAVEGRVVIQLRDSSGRAERYTTTPVFARDFSNRLLASATKAQQFLQGGEIKEGG